MTTPQTKVLNDGDGARFERFDHMHKTRFI